MRKRRQGECPCLFIFIAVLGAIAAGAADAAYQGEIWTEVAVGLDDPLNAVAYQNRAAAWAVGDNGSVVRLRGGTWAPFPGGSGENLRGVAALGSGEAWAVGDNGTIMYYDGAAWAEHPSSGAVTTLDLKAVAFINPANGWVVGGRAGAGGVVLHYNGTSWMSLSVTGQPLNDVEVLASDRIWFCGDNRTMLKFDGTLFTPQADFIGDGKSWRAFSFPFSTMGWVVGDAGTVGRYTPGGWAQDVVSSLATTADLLGVAVVSEPVEFGYAVGKGGVRIRLDADGKFRADASGGEDLHGIALPNFLEGAAVGGVGGPRLINLRLVSTEEGLGNVRVFPNPFEPRAGQVLTFDRLPRSVDRIRIVTLLGDVVAELGEGIELNREVGVATWRGTTRAGRRLAAGPYIWSVGAPGVKGRSGVLALVKR